MYARRPTLSFPKLNHETLTIFFCEQAYDVHAWRPRCLRMMPKKFTHDAQNPRGETSIF